MNKRGPCKGSVRALTDLQDVFHAAHFQKADPAPERKSVSCCARASARGARAARRGGRGSGTSSGSGGRSGAPRSGRRLLGRSAALKRRVHAYLPFVPWEGPEDDAALNGFGDPLEALLHPLEGPLLRYGLSGAVQQRLRPARAPAGKPWTGSRTWTSRSGTQTRPLAGRRRSELERRLKRR